MPSPELLHILSLLPLLNSLLLLWQRKPPLILHHYLFCEVSPDLPIKASPSLSCSPKALCTYFHSCAQDLLHCTVGIWWLFSHPEAREQWLSLHPPAPIFWFGTRKHLVSTWWMTVPFIIGTLICKCFLVYVSALQVIKKSVESGGG